MFKLAPIASLVWVFPEVRRLYVPVVDLVRQTSSQLNFNDALIVVACHELGIDTLLSFDFDDVAGLTCLK